MDVGVILCACLFGFEVDFVFLLKYTKYKAKGKKLLNEVFAGSEKRKIQGYVGYLKIFLSCF